MNFMSKFMKMIRMVVKEKLMKRTKMEEHTVLTALAEDANHVLF